MDALLINDVALLRSLGPRSRGKGDEGGGGRPEGVEGDEAFDHGKGVDGVHGGFGGRRGTHLEVGDVAWVLG
jgi:hypothetical protein